MARKKKEIPPMQEEDLRRLAELALEKYHGKISTTIIQRSGQEGILPKSFYLRYGKGPEKMEALVRTIRELDPDRYGFIRYERIHDGPASRTKLNPEEEKIIVDMIIKSSEDDRWRSDNPPLELIQSIQATLEQNNFYRSISSLTSHARNIWSKQKVTGLPAYARSPRPKAKPEEDVDAKEELEKKLDDFQKEKKDKTIDDMIDDDKNEQDKSHYLALASRGHQALVAYMMDPKNYKKLLGSDYELVAVDFTKANTPADLYEKCQDRAEALEKICEQEEDIVSFVDNWLRCDMIFRDGEGNYHVAEIKQNAINHNGREGYPNADKVVEQVSAYTGGLRGRIQWMNRNRPDGKKIPEQVEGIVIAYVIDDDLHDFLMEKDELRPIKVSKRAVGSYLKGLGTAQ